MAFCINCGKQLPEGAKFCLECGTPVAVVPAAAPAPAPAPTPAPEPTPVVENIPEPVIEPVVAPEPKPEPEPIPEPIPAPVSGSEPVQQSTPVPAMQFTQVQSEDADNDLNMEGPPVVGNYSIPGMENAAAPVDQEEKKYTGYPPNYVAPTPQPPKAAKPGKAPKQPRQSSASGKKIGIIIGIAAGAIVLIVALILIVSTVISRIGGSSAKGKNGTGTALTELLDNAAATHYNGGGSSNTSLKDEPDENYVDEEDDEEELLDASSADEKLFQGCMYATLPAGFIQGGSDGTSEEEFYREDNDDCKIKLHVSSGGRAREKAEEDVQWWIDSGKGEGYEIVDDIDAGEYTWTVEHFPFNNENSSAKFYADVDDKYHLEVVCFMMNETDPDVIAFLESIHMADGDPGKLRSEWLDSRNK